MDLFEVPEGRLLHTYALYAEQESLLQGQNVSHLESQIKYRHIKRAL
jgi:hypothetical protein